MKIHQPRHLNRKFATLSRLSYHIWVKIYLTFGVVFGPLALILLTFRVSQDLELPWYRWLAAASAGVLFAAIIHALARLLDRLPRYVELRGGRLLLRVLGDDISIKRICDVTITPELVEKDCYRVTVIYTTPFLRCERRWWMLIEDLDSANMLKKIVHEAKNKEK